MLEEFVNYVDSFYGQDDPLYPMMSRETKQPLTKFDIQRATQNTLQCVLMKQTSFAHGGMEILLIVRESETFYLKSTTTSL